jgi:hypothetical protein
LVTVLASAIRADAETLVVAKDDLDMSDGHLSK